MGNFYFIRAINQDGLEMFYAIDNHSGGYPYWTTMFTDAKLFKNEQEALDVLNTPEFTEEQKFTDGKVFPASLIQSGCCTDLRHTTGHLVVYVCKIEFSNIETKRYSGDIKM